jgi:hypothetical protein
VQRSLNSASIFKVIVKNLKSGGNSGKKRENQKNSKDQPEVVEYIIVFPNYVVGVLLTQLKKEI